MLEKTSILCDAGYDFTVRRDGISNDKVNTQHILLTSHLYYTHPMHIKSFFNVYLMIFPTALFFCLTSEVNI